MDDYKVGNYLIHKNYRQEISGGFYKIINKTDNVCVLMEPNETQFTFDVSHSAMFYYRLATKMEIALYG